MPSVLACIHYELHVTEAESHSNRVQNPPCCTRTLTHRPHAEQQTERTRQRTAQERERVATLPPGVTGSVVDIEACEGVAHTGVPTVATRAHQQMHVATTDSHSNRLQERCMQRGALASSSIGGTAAVSGESSPSASIPAPGKCTDANTATRHCSGLRLPRNASAHAATAAASFGSACAFRNIATHARANQQPQMAASVQARQVCMHVREPVHTAQLCGRRQRLS